MPRYFPEVVWRAVYFIQGLDSISTLPLGFVGGAEHGCADMRGRTHERMKALSENKILDTLREDSFDAIAKLASEICVTPYTTISFAESDRQWFKSEGGLTVSESRLAGSFCAHAIAQKPPLIVPDASVDPRFVEIPYVASAPGIRFYAAVQLRSTKGLALGVLCVLDVDPIKHAAA